MKGPKGGKGLPWWILAALLAMFAACSGDSADSAAARGSEAPKGPEPAAASPVAPGRSVSPAFDLGAVMRQVHFAFRAEGDGWSGGHGTYASRVSAGGALEMTPVQGGAGHEVRRAQAAFRAETVEVARGGAALVGRGQAGQMALGEDAHAVVTRGEVMEHLRNTEDGVEQSWTFARRPAGSGDLTVRVRVSGHAYTGETEGGLHFAEAETGLGVRYGWATWVDARGAKAGVRGRFEEGEVVMVVPGAVVEGAAYPAVLDPVIGPEFGMDTVAVVPADTVTGAPSLAFDGSNYLVVWTDTRLDGLGDIYGARVSTAGVLLDRSGLAISTAAKAQSWPKVTYGVGQFLVVWADDRTYNGTQFSLSDIYGARVSTAGTVLDPGGIAISTAAYAQLSPTAAFDGTNYFVIWMDGRYGYSMIHGARVSTNGTVIDSNGISIVTGTSPAIAFDGTNYFVAFESYYSGNWHIDGARVAKDGSLLGNIVNVSTGGAYRSSPAVAFDGANYFLVAWTDTRNGGSSDIYGARVSATGTVLDANGIGISTAAGSQTSPAVGYDGSNYFVAWTDNRIDSAGDVYGARVSKTGTVLDVAGVALSNGPNAQSQPTVAYDGTNYLLAWLDSAGGKASVLATRITKSAGVIDAGGLALSAYLAQERAPASAAFDGTNYLVVWQDCRSTAVPSCPNGDIYGVRVAASGTVLDPSGIAIANTTVPETNPAVAYDGTNYLVAWEASSALKASRVTVGGAILDSTPFLVTVTSSDRQLPAIACDGTNCLIVWQSGSTTGTFDVFGARVNKAGAVLDGSGFPISVASSDQLAPAVDFDGTNYFVVWQDGRTSGNADIYGARITPFGSLLDGTGIPISTATNAQSNPAVAFDGTNHLVVWDDARNPTVDIYGTRVNKTGTVLDSSGIAISQAPGAQTLPAVAYTGDGSTYLVTWRDTRNTSADIYASWITTAGTLLDPPGVAIANSTSWNETAPALASEGAGRVLIAYEGGDPALGAGTARIRARFAASGAVQGATCTADSECGSRTCADSVCCNTACNSPCQSCSLVPGTCTSVKNADDPDTCTGTSTCDATGACKKKNGQACSLATECASGSCADGFCCNAPCTGGCDVCNATPGTCTPAAAGSPGAGPSCAPYLCNGGATCPTQCFADSDCVASRYCAADSTCQPRRNQGAVCDPNAGKDCLVQGCRICASAACADGFCCDTSCSGPCDTCAAALGAAANGTCTNAPAGAAGSPSCAPYLCGGTTSGCATSCATSADCAPTAYCRTSDGTCQTDQALGSACAAASECQSGFCVDGVCCDQACGGLCQACSKTSKGYGFDGLCANVQDGLDPRGDCPDDGADSCGHDGTCNGGGVCRYYKQGTSCGSGGVCNGNVAKGHLCNGNGACVADPTGVDCAPYVCTGTGCKASCAVDGDCSAGNTCTSGACVPKSTPGTACAKPTECASGFCVDGVCCDAPCKGQCEACDVAGTVGSCQAVAGAPHGSRPACTGTGDVCGGACDGLDSSACAYPLSNADCGTTCADGQETKRTCDGQGSCSVGEPTACPGGYGCDGATKCKTSCANDDDCGTGYVCASGKCAPKGGAKCSADLTASEGPGGSKPCDPYRCDPSSGVCKQVCSRVDDCLPPNECDDTKNKCVAPTDPGSPPSSGCGCRVEGRGAPEGGVLVLALGALIAGRRRRARRPG